ncbi:MAG: hypothetical protein Q9222_007336, partial [Ikaeria aurantiellina]
MAEVVYTGVTDADGIRALDQYAAGPPAGTVRTVGSITQPAKSGRTKFTSEDDRILVNWVVGIERSGGATSGNEIYKQLYAKNPRHPWQAWRDRWVKSLKNLPRSTYIPQNAPPTPPADQSLESERHPSGTPKSNLKHKPFTKEDAEELLSVGEDIINILPEKLEDAWSAWAENRDDPDDHTAQEWQKFWEDSIRPIHLKRRAQAAHSSPEPVEMAEPTPGKSNEPGRQGTANLVVRTSPAQVQQAQRRTSRSPSYHPESPSRRMTAAATEQRGSDFGNAALDGTRDEEPLPSSPIKRKRGASEDVEEVPSSSPPEVRNPAKRRRHREAETSFTEIASTPQRRSLTDQSGEIPDTYTTNQPRAADVVELDDEEDAYDFSEEEDYELEGSRSPSPELGASPRKSPSSNIERSVSKTQAIFHEPDLPPDLDVALPPGGWSDEEDDIGGGSEDTQNKGSGQADDDEREDEEDK